MSLQLSLPMKLILVAAIPGVLATMMFSFSSQADGSAATALYRFALTFAVTAFNFCVITWNSHRVSELRDDLTAEQLLRHEADDRAENAEKTITEMDTRLKELEADKKCLEKLKEAWTPQDDVTLLEMLRREK